MSQIWATDAQMIEAVDEAMTTLETVRRWLIAYAGTSKPSDWHHMQALIESRQRKIKKTLGTSDETKTDDVREEPDGVDGCHCGRVEPGGDVPN